MAKSPRYNLSSFNPLKIRKSARYLPRHSNLTSPIRINIKGLDCSVSTFSDVYKPLNRPVKRQRFKSETVGAVCLRQDFVLQQLGTSLTWIGLTLDNAMVLHELHCVLVPCLEDLLAEQLQELDTAIRQQYYPFRDSEETHKIKFPVADLIRLIFGRMRVALFKDWSLEAIMEFVLLFLSSFGSFEQLPTESAVDTRMTVKLRPGFDPFAETVPAPVAHVVSCLDYISFPDLDALPREGSELVLIPRYYSGLSGKRKVTGVSYKLIPSYPWLEWDDDISGFRGKIPLFSEDRAKMSNTGEEPYYGSEGPYRVLSLLRIEVKASVLDHHSASTISLSRTCRARVSLKVMPWYARRTSEPSFGTGNNTACLDENYSIRSCSPSDHGHPLPREYLANDYDAQKIPAVRLSCGNVDQISRSGNGNVYERLGLAQGLDKDEIQVYHLESSIEQWHLHSRDHAARESWYNFGEAEKSSVHADGQTVSGVGFRHVRQTGPHSEDVFFGAPGTGTSLRRSRDVSSKCSDDSHIPDCDYRKTTNRNKKRRTESNTHSLIPSSARTPRETYRSILDDHESTTHNYQDDFHWQDASLFNRDFFDEHEHRERLQSLHEVSPELHCMVGGLHRQDSNKMHSHELQHAEDCTIDGSNCHGQTTSSTDIPAAQPYDMLTHPYVNERTTRQSSLTKPMLRLDVDEPAAQLQVDKTEASPLSKQTPARRPHIMCFLNHYSVLGKMREGSVEETDGDHVDHGLPMTPAASPNPSRSASGAPSSDSEIEIIINRDSKTHSWQSSRPSHGKGDRQVESDRYREDKSNKQPTTTARRIENAHNQENRKTSESDLSYSCSIGSGKDDPSVVLPLYEFFREDASEPNTESHAHPLNSSRSISQTAHDSQDPVKVPPTYPHRTLPPLAAACEIDPCVRLEQAQLWNVFSRIPGPNNSSTAEEQRDWKLEAEERLGLWEVLQLETRQRRNSECTDGVDSAGNIELGSLPSDNEGGICDCGNEACRCDEEGKEDVVESRKPSATSAADGFEDEMEMAWNFGC